jgi:hypothetical protein
MTVKEIAEKSGCSVSWVYAIARKLKRLPTVDEVRARKNKRGRPALWSQINNKGE